MKYEEAHHDQPGDESPAAPPQTIERLTGPRLQRMMMMDDLVRIGGLVLAVAAMVALSLTSTNRSMGAMLLALLVIVGWLSLSVNSARVTRELPALTALIGANAAAAEDVLARFLRRWGLLRSVRALLLHRYAMLRHRQDRFDEVAEVCHWLTQRPLGLARDVRPHLLLMLTEARLEQGDLWGAFHALQELYQTRLTLIEALQRMALQTRYEVAIGAHGAALQAVEHKCQLAELLPAAQCGAVHALLATSARAEHREELANWLWDRTKLLCSDAQLQQLADGRFGARVAEAMSDGLGPGA